MSKDPRVEAALNHWAPRFVANGIPLTDFQEVTAAIERWEDWCSAWQPAAPSTKIWAARLSTPETA